MIENVWNEDKYMLPMRAKLPQDGVLHHQSGWAVCIKLAEARPYLIEGVYTRLRAFLLLVNRSRVELYNW